jgi:predicted CXXCH cytochrome family protein
VLAAMVWLGACTDTKTVFRDRDDFNPPPDAASGFLGYFSANTNQTTCGNCHVDHQADWITHAHSDAWATLVNSGHAQASCEGCHTVNERGNALDTPSGYNAVKDPGYYDVQCESCHGPGYTHVQAPDASPPPLARVGASTAANSGTCGECHSGTHHPYVEQWEASRHAEPNEEVIDEAIADPVGRASCMSCHEGRAALRSFGVTDNYIERDQPLSHATAQGITCAVCHDPHGGTGNSSQLRFPIDDPNIDNNLCTQCHARRSVPQVTSNRGPHAPQGPVLFGYAGWFPPGVDTTAQPTSHGDPAVNPRLCAGCHVRRQTVTDAVTGDFQLESVGHLFRPIPCLDPVSGEPVGGNACAYDGTERTWAACTGAGCHANQGAVLAAFNANRAVLATLGDQIWVDANGSGDVEAGDTGFLALVAANAPGEFSTSDGLITVAEGALFNMRLVAEGRYANGDKSMGVHNPFLSQKLLAVSIQALQAQYPFLPAPPASVKALVEQALARAHAGRTVSVR